MKFEPKTIVIFNHRHMGDLLGSTPAILALRTRYPKARIVNVAAPMPLNVLKHSLLVDKLIAHPKNWRGTLSALRQIRREKPDLAICLSGSIRVAVMARLCGAKVRAGYAPSKYTFPLTLKVHRAGPPSLQLDLTMAQALDAPVVKENYVGLLEPTADELVLVDKWLRDKNADLGKPLVGINMGASVERRRWDVENFAAVCDALGDETQLIVFGGPGDLELVGKLQSLTRAPLLIAAGEFSPRETAALMQRCATVITSDTGPMHLAMAVNTPVVALFGLVPSSLRVPPGFGHIALEHNEACQKMDQPLCRYESHCQCLNAIMPAEVVAAARVQFAKQAVGDQDCREELCKSFGSTARP